MVYRRLHLIQSLLYPPVCVLCGQPGSGDLDLCDPCRRELPYNGPACTGCALPLPATPAGTEPEGAGLCGRCLAGAPLAQRAFALFRYAPPVNHLVYALKFGGRLQYARLLGELTAAALARRDQPAPGMILPVPLHPGRQRRRGFNQAIELARPVARRLGAVLELRACRRVRPTEAQSALEASERRRNVRGAFAWRGPPPAAHVAVFDDVITTGRTVGELVRLLRRQGVKTVEVWSVARALPPGR
ncbi:MAG: ComF family protein [Gammaproteobacteria bacterium]|nr:ComF family protein [Gammaproteobacteria bacterium]